MYIDPWLQHSVLITHQLLTEETLAVFHLGSVLLGYKLLYKVCLQIGGHFGTGNSQEGIDRNSILAGFGKNYE